MVHQLHALRAGDPPDEKAPGEQHDAAPAQGPAQRAGPALARLLTWSAARMNAKIAGDARVLASRSIEDTRAG